MCLKSTLDKMLRISGLLSQLSIDKLNIVGELYVSSKSMTPIDDGMEGESSPLEIAKKRFSFNAIEAFVYILDFLLVSRDSEQEAKVISDNAVSYIDMLKKTVSEVPGFIKMSMDEGIYCKYEQANHKLLELQEPDLVTNLLLCKRAIFE